MSKQRKEDRQVDLTDRVMTDAEIIKSFRKSDYPTEQVEIILELNGWVSNEKGYDYLPAETQKARDYVTNLLIASIGNEEYQYLMSLKPDKVKREVWAS